MTTSKPRRTVFVTTYSCGPDSHYAQAFDLETCERVADSAGYTRQQALRALRDKSAMLGGVEIASIRTVEGRIYTLEQAFDAAAEA